MCIFIYQIVLMSKKGMYLTSDGRPIRKSSATNTKPEELEVSAEAEEIIDND